MFRFPGFPGSNGAVVSFREPSYTSLGDYIIDNIGRGWGDKLKINMILRFKFTSYTI